MPLWVPKGMGLTPEEEQVKCYLKRYATGDKDGKLRSSELKVALKDLGLHFSGFRAKRAIHYADVNGDLYIDEVEMNELVRYTVKWRLSNKGAPENFNLEDYPYFMEKNWFTAEELDCFCERPNSFEN